MVLGHKFSHSFTTVATRAVVSLYALLGSFVPAWADLNCAIICEMADKPFWRIDLPARTQSDCSFDRAGDEWNLSLEADATVDIGAGRTSQNWVAGGCGIVEYLVVVDCNTEEVVSVRGACGTRQQTMEVTGGRREHGIYSTKLLFPPYGELDLSVSPTVKQVTEIAKSAGSFLVEGIPFTVNKIRNRVDPFCGCRQFYPDLVGALR